MLAGNMNPNQQRPVGVTLIALAFLWIGIGGTLLFTIIILTGGSVLLWRIPLGSLIHSNTELKVVSYALNFSLYVAYIAYAVIGFGLWKLRNWARKCVFGICLIGVLAALMIPAAFKMPVLMSICVIGMAATELGWIGWYFMRPRVQNAFGRWNRYTPDGEWIQPPRLSTRGRLVAGAVFAGLLVILFIIPLSAEVNKMMEDSGAFKLTMSTAQASPCVSGELGLPLESGSISGALTESPSDGSADLSIPVKGPKGKGTLDVQANKLKGDWRIESLVFKHGSSRSIIIPSDSNGDCR